MKLPRWNVGTTFGVGATRWWSLYVRSSGMSESVVVRVTQGDLRGRKIITKSGLQYYSFQGIPYATPPVGNLRFKVSIFILCKK
jgi:hypothetical protein